MSAFELFTDWILDITKYFATLWSTLATPFISVGDLQISWIGLISTSVISVILIAKLVDVFNPIG